jgi:hypothetical protein
MNQTRSEALHAARRQEAHRRGMLRTIRAAVAEAGFSAHMRLDQPSNRGHHLISTPPVAGIDLRRFERRVEGGVDPEMTETYLEHALALADLFDIAQRRNEAIEEAGGDVSSPPAWAFLGHPVIRGVIAALVDEPSAYQPLDKTDWQPGVKLSPTVHDLRLGHVGVRLTHGGVRFSIDCANEVACIRIAGTYPDTLVAGLPDMPLWKLVQLPGIAEGTPAGDAPIRDAKQRGDALVVSVACRLEALADPPEGIDVGWLWEWFERHGR